MEVVILLEIDSKHGKGSHSIPDVGRFAGKFDYNWSVENKRYYHESLWIQNFTTNHTTNTCLNESGKLFESNSLADATNEEVPIVDAYDCGIDGDDTDPYINGTGMTLMRHVIK